MLDLTQFSSVEEYIQKGMNATARNRYRYSVKNNYESRLADLQMRNFYLPDIHQINISKEERQGREMSKSYKDFPQAFTTEESCDQHYSKWILCYDCHGTAVAYITINFCGEMAGASQILGHADYLNDGVMLNAWVEFVRVCMEKKIKYIIYSRWSDGLQGLQYWKHSVGMQPITISEK